MCHCTEAQKFEHNIEACRKWMGEYNEAIETRFDVKYANLDVDGRMIQERKLLGFYMED